jgi:putative PIN family toxin of toxin-antitoxin system
LDPGVLISGLISGKGAPRDLLWLWLEGSFELVVCPSLLAELGRVLLRPKFRPYVTGKEVRAYVALLRRLVSLEPDPEATAGLTPDPGDDYLMALARAAKAEFIVSGDPHPHRTQASSTARANPESFPATFGFLISSN